MNGSLATPENAEIIKGLLRDFFERFPNCEVYDDAMRCIGTGKEMHLTTAMDGAVVIISGVSVKSASLRSGQWDVAVVPETRTVLNMFFSKGYMSQVLQFTGKSLTQNERYSHPTGVPV